MDIQKLWHKNSLCAAKTHGGISGGLSRRQIGHNNGIDLAHCVLERMDDRNTHKTSLSRG